MNALDSEERILNSLQQVAKLPSAGGTVLIKGHKGPEAALDGWRSLLSGQLALPGSLSLHTFYNPFLRSVTVLQLFCIICSLDYDRNAEEQQSISAQSISMAAQQSQVRVAARSHERACRVIPRSLLERFLASRVPSD